MARGREIWRRPASARSRRAKWPRRSSKLCTTFEAGGTRIMRSKTLLDKVWDAHVVRELEDGRTLLYVDRHLVHEVTSPQAFEGLRLAGRKVRRPDLTFATVDHNVPTSSRHLPIADPLARQQVETLRSNASAFGVPLYDFDSGRQGIVHIIGPELGLTLPGTTIVCGDSHTSTHGAFGAFAFGIGTSEVEHVLATQCLWLTKPKTMEINFIGEPKNLLAVSAKDIILALIRKIGIGGGIGAVVEYRGEIIKKFSMEKRMTICNMSIEAGARAGLIAPDDITFEYIRNREYSPKGEKFEKMVTYWKENLKTDNNSIFDKKVEVNISNLSPQVSWGTNPSMVVDVTGIIPYADEYAMGNEDEKKAATRALEYMDLKSGTPITDVCIDRVFIGSCTNSRLEDLLEASVIVKGRKVSPKVHAMVVPGSQSVKLKAEKLGLDKIFIESG